MPRHRLRRAAAAALLAAALASLPACRKPQANLEWGQTVRGKVTHKGAPVPFGFVLFYHAEKSVDPKTGLFVPVAFGRLDADGTYQLTNVPVGPVIVCVVTDPDADPAAVMRPTAMGGITPGGPAGGAPGGPPGPPDGPPGAPPPGPPPPPPGGPPGHPPPPPGPHPGGPGAGPAHPVVAKLTDAQKQTLKDLHAKYGVFGKSPLHYHVGVGEQTFNIPLK